MEMDKTVARKSPERLTRGAKPKGRRNIQSNPFISQVGEIKVSMNDEVIGSIPINGSEKNDHMVIFLLIGMKLEVVEKGFFCDIFISCAR